MSEILNIVVLGGGVIGVSWIVFFFVVGWNVFVFDFDFEIEVKVCFYVEWVWLVFE